MNATPQKPDRTLLVVLALIAVLVVVSLAVVFTRGAPAELDAASPEGVVQRYATAVTAGDEQTAKSYLSAEARESCTPVDHAADGSVRVTLVSTTVRPDSADVAVSIVTSTGDSPLGSDEYQSDGVVDLVRQGGEWKVDHTPWELAVCTENEVTR